MPDPTWLDQPGIYVPAPPVPDRPDYAESLLHEAERTAQGGLIAASERGAAVAESVGLGVTE